MSNQDMSNFSMLELFRMEAEAQVSILNENLLALENNPNPATALESLMRASHSIKGAGRIVGLDAVVTVAHVMEDCFVAAQSGTIALDYPQKIDILLQGVDRLNSISLLSENQLESWLNENQENLDNLVNTITTIIKNEPLANLTSTSKSSPDISPTITIETISENQPIAETLLFSEELLSDFIISEPSINTSLKPDFSMLKHLQKEIKISGNVLKTSLLEVQQTSETEIAIPTLIQAAHIIKGSGKIVQLESIIKLSFAIEETLKKIQGDRALLNNVRLNHLLECVNFLLQVVEISESDLESWLLKHREQINQLITNLLSNIDSVSDNSIKITEIHDRQGAKKIEISPQKNESKPEESLSKIAPQTSAIAHQPPQPITPVISPHKTSPEAAKNPERIVKVSADNLNRLMGLAGESLVEVNWLQPFADSLFKLRHHQVELYQLLEKLQESLADISLSQKSKNYLDSARKQANKCHYFLTDRLNDLEIFARRSANLSDRLYREVIASHMRPFADGVQAFPRMVRDLSRQMGKQVKLEILGKSTKVDRDILEKLEAPLTHILRNGVDHGIELPEERIALGKPPEGTIRLEAVHRGGMLSLTITDDGRGVDLEKLRQKIVNQGMVNRDMASQLTEPELMEFLFLPGFSTAQKVTEISGRGVGLDVVQSMIQEVGGILRAVSDQGKGMTFHLQLPLTLSVIRTLLVDISGEPYAFPLTRIDRILMIHRAEIKVAENRQYFCLDHQKNIGLVPAYQVLELPPPQVESELLPVIIISDRVNSYGLAVDKFLGERALVVRPLDPSLGKVMDINAAALMEDGSPVLIIDVEDIVRSIDKLLSVGYLNKVGQTTHTIKQKKKRILVVDDSITVREMERKLLENNGYMVEIAVNGIEAFNAIKMSYFDLVITDIDMPKMNGIDLVSQIKNNPKYQSIPVIIVSYKDRQEDKIRGLEVGADYYLAKSSFDDNSLLNAVLDLIGP
jgi:two-component system, chemotaxis family, sensor histidine kinase and response regulator WspE